jgi:polar amino acid transport system permease protein
VSSAGSLGSLGSLGPFAPEQGNRSRWAAASFVVACAAAALLGARAIADRTGGHHRVLTTVAFFAAAAAAALGVAALYDTATRGRSGRHLATLALTVAFGTGIANYVYAGSVDGTLMPGNFVRAFFDVNILRDSAPSLVRGAVNTIRLAFTAEALSLMLGLFVATLNLSPRRWLHYPAVVYVDVIRGLPLLVLTFLVYGGLPKLGITLREFVAAVMVLMINGAAYTSEIFRAGLQAVPRAQRDAARGLGMTHGASMLFVVIPQAVRTVIPPLTSDFIALIKDTALVMFVIGFTPLTADLFGAARTGAASTFSPTPFIGAAIGYLVITVPLARLVGYLERRARTGLA